MEISLSPHLKAQSLPSFPLNPMKKKASIASSLPSSLQINQKISLCSKMKCGKGGMISEMKRKFEDDEMMLEDEELIGIMVKSSEEKCCKERNGIAEMLECLEREAIMGEDEGKEPTDYNRRAHIFDKSSRVFRALKETNDRKDS